MKKYPEYKDSGVEWLGEVPEHWALVDLKFLLDYASNSMRIGPFGSSLKSEFIRAKGFKVYGQEHVIKNDFSLGEKYIDEQKFNELQPYEISTGDVLVTMMGTIGKCKVVPNKIERGIMDSHLIRIRFHAKKAFSDFLSLIINDSDYIANNVKVLSKGSIMDGLNSSIIRVLKIALPPKPEQQQILSYLDRATARLDRFITLRQQQCALLKEQRAALIQQAVTKGIRPGVKMKDSGVEWIGEVPEGWEVCKLKHKVKKVGSGVTPKGGAEVYLKEGIPFLRSQNIHFDHLDLTDIACISEEIHAEMSGTKVKEGDVLLNITGASLGRCYYADENLGEANVNQHVCIIRPRFSLLRTRYLHLLLSSEIGQSQIWKDQTGSGREGLNFEAIRNFDFSFPDLAEQQEIIDYIIRETAELDLLSQKYERQIELMREYRASLIAAAVTGKIDVRTQ